MRPIAQVEIVEMEAVERVGIEADPFERRTRPGEEDAVERLRAAQYRRLCAEKAADDTAVRSRQAHPARRVRGAGPVPGGTVQAIAPGNADQVERDKMAAQARRKIAGEKADIVMAENQPIASRAGETARITFGERTCIGDVHELEFVISRPTCAARSARITP